MKIGSLFSGIGGLELGLERAGLGDTVWQVEIDPFCRSVLARHWPRAERFTDVRTVGSHNLTAVDVLCGGFPCQDVSQAARGRNAGMQGERSGLWREFARVIDELRPGVVVVENVAGGVNRWLPTVSGDLAVLGYSARPYGISARDVGAPHLRERVFVVAYSDGDREPACPVHVKACELPENARAMWNGWTSEPRRFRVAHGVSGGLDGRRLKALGNAVVPQCAEAVGRMILHTQAARRVKAA
jgi:DNA (cytosine-5)-methyltransferase 1